MAAVSQQIRMLENEFGVIPSTEPDVIHIAIELVMRWCRRRANGYRADGPSLGPVRCGGDIILPIAPRK